MARAPLALMLAVVLLVGITAAPGWYPSPAAQPEPETAEVANGPLAEPQDWMNNQRAFPRNTVGFGAWEAAAADAKAVGRATAQSNPRVAAADWNLIGPTNVGGRVTDVAIDVEVPGQVFIAAASGGVWKTTNANSTYEPAWPDDLTQAVGALAMSPNGTLFAGTGETNPGGGSLTFGGTGMYRSRDRGESWQRVGLERSGAFGRIVTHPRKSRILYAAAAGHLYLPGGQRGVFKSIDGGDSWQRVLAGENSTSGASDLAMDPDNPNRLYAVMWDHQRTPGLRVYGGRGSGLYMTKNAGRSWRRVGSAYGLPARSEDIGRMAVAVAPSNARRVYVTAIGKDNRYDEFYVSNNRGRSFSTIDESPLIGQSQASSGWWFGKIFVDPADHTCSSPVCSSSSPVTVAPPPSSMSRCTPISTPCSGTRSRRGRSTSETTAGCTAPGSTARTAPTACPDTCRGLSTTPLMWEPRTRPGS